MRKRRSKLQISDRDKIGAKIIALGEHYNRKLSPEVVNDYIDDLCDYSATQVIEAIGEARKSSTKGLPNSATIREILVNKSRHSLPQYQGGMSDSEWKAAKYQRRQRNIAWDKYLQESPGEAHGDVQEFCNTYPYMACGFHSRQFPVEIIKAQIMSWKEDRHSFEDDIKADDPARIPEDYDHEEAIQYIWRQVQRKFDGQIKPFRPNI